MLANYLGPKPVVDVFLRIVQCVSTKKECRFQSIALLISLLITYLITFVVWLRSNILKKRVNWKGYIHKLRTLKLSVHVFINLLVEKRDLAINWT